MAYLGRDEWDRRPSAGRANHTSFHLSADAMYEDGGLYRTRSSGSRATPIVNVYNDVHNDAINRTDALQPPGAYPSGSGGGYAADQEYRRGRMLNDELADEISQLRIERSRHRSRSRPYSRGPSPDDYYYRHEASRERAKAEAEIQYLKEDARRRQHEIDEHAEKKRILAEYEKKLRDQKQHDKELEDRYREKIEREKREAKERDEELYRKFLLKQKEEKEKKEREEKEEKHKLEDALRKRLAERGFSGSQIEAIVNDKKEEKKTTTTTTTSMQVWNGNATPVFAKIHKDYLSVETLKWYDIPYKWDDHDSDYLIILREMDKHETNILFEHTKALRAGRLAIDAPKKEKDYAFVRKHRERSKSRRRSGEWKSFGIIEIKK